MAEIEAAAIQAEAGTKAGKRAEAVAVVATEAAAVKRVAAVAIGMMSVGAVVTEAVVTEVAAVTAMNAGGCPPVDEPVAIGEATGLATSAAPTILPDAWIASSAVTRRMGRAMAVHEAVR